MIADKPNERERDRNEKLTLMRFAGLRGKGLRIEQELSSVSNVIALFALGFRCTDVESRGVWKG